MGSLLMKTGRKCAKVFCVVLVLAMTFAVVPPVYVDGSANGVQAQSAALPFWTAVPSFEQENTRNPESVSVAGRTINNAVSNNQNWNNGLRAHNLQGQYATLTGYIGRIDGSTRNDGLILFFGDNRLLASFIIGVDDLARSISVDVTGVHMLEIHFDRHFGNTRVAFGEAVVVPSGITLPLQTSSHILCASRSQVVGESNISRHRPFSMGEDVYMHAISNNWNWNDAWIIYNLNGRYHSLTGTIGHVPGAAGNMGRIRFVSLLDGAVLGDFFVVPGAPTQDIEVDVTDVHMIRIDFYRPAGNTNIALANTWVHMAEATPPAPSRPPGSLPFWAAVGHHGQGSIAGPGAVSMSGIPFSNAVSNNQSWNDGWRLHNLEGRYTTLTGYIGRIDGSGRNSGTIVFIGNDRLLAAYEIGVYDVPRFISIDVTGVHRLGIDIIRNSGNARFAFAEAMILPSAVQRPLPTNPTHLFSLTHTEQSNISTGTIARMSGNVYNHQISNNQNWNDGWRQYNLNAQFETFTGIIGHIDGAPRNSGSIRFTSVTDGRILGEFTVDPNDLPKQITLNVTGVHLFRIDFLRAGANTRVALTQPWLYEPRPRPPLTISVDPTSLTIVNRANAAVEFTITVSGMPPNDRFDIVTGSSVSNGISIEGLPTGITASGYVITDDQGSGEGIVTLTMTTPINPTRTDDQAELLRLAKQLFGD